MTGQSINPIPINNVHLDWTDFHTENEMAKHLTRHLKNQ